MSQRFSDAELAAEYWRAEADNDWISMMSRCQDGAWDASKAAHAHRKTTLHRFATLPHAHEEPRAYVFQCEHCIAYWETDNEEHRNTFARNHQYLAHQRQGYTK